MYGADAFHVSGTRYDVKRFVYHISKHKKNAGFGVLFMLIGTAYTGIMVLNTGKRIHLVNQTAKQL